MRLTPSGASRLLGALLVAVACAGSKEPGEMGDDCYRDEDCKSGLVCVANANRVRVCSNDVTGLASTVEGPPAPEDAGAPEDDAAVTEEPAPEDDAGAGQ